jgi:cytochrome c5
MRIALAAVLGILLAACSLKVLGGQSQAQAAQQKTPKAAAGSTTDEQEGEKRFRQNCGRCHHAPESISPREVKAVIQHMRVRAMLSADDERLILKYLAP